MYGEEADEQPVASNEHRAASCEGRCGERKAWKRGSGRREAIRATSNEARAARIEVRAKKKVVRARFQYERM